MSGAWNSSVVGGRPGTRRRLRPARRPFPGAAARSRIRAASAVGLAARLRARCCCGSAAARGSAAAASGVRAAAAARRRLRARPEPSPWGAAASGGCPPDGLPSRRRGSCASCLPSSVPLSCVLSVFSFSTIAGALLDRLAVPRSPGTLRGRRRCAPAPQSFSDAAGSWLGRILLYVFRRPPRPTVPGDSRPQAFFWCLPAAAAGTTSTDYRMPGTARGCLAGSAAHAPCHNPNCVRRPTAERRPTAPRRLPDRRRRSSDSGRRSC